MSFKWPEPVVDPDTGDTFGPGVVLETALSANGRRAAAWHKDGQVTVCDVAAGKIAATFKAVANSQFDSLALAPDGKTVATALGNGTVKLWDADTGKEKAVLGAFNRSADTVRGVRFSDDGKSLVVAEWKAVHVWDLATEKKRGSVGTDLVASSNGVALSPDGNTLAIAARDKHLRLVDVASGKELARAPWVSDPGDVMFSPDGTLLASVRGGRVRIWDIKAAAGK
jgi:WD40 repeat protein